MPHRKQIRHSVQVIHMSIISWETLAHCLEAMFVYFIQWYSLLPSWCNLALNWRWTHAHDMNLLLQSVARWKHSIVFHWVSNLIHMAQTWQSDWRFCSWIINEFENKYLWLWISQNLYLVLAVPKYPPPMDHTELCTQFPRKTAAVYAGFQTLMIQVLGAGIPEFCKILNDFPEILVKIYKIFGKLMGFQSGPPSILAFFHWGWVAGGTLLKRFCLCKFKILPPPQKKRKKHPFLKNTSQKL